MDLENFPTRETAKGTMLVLELSGPFQMHGITWWLTLAA